MVNFWISTKKKGDLSGKFLNLNKKKRCFKVTQSLGQWASEVFYLSDEDGAPLVALRVLARFLVDSTNATP